MDRDKVLYLAKELQKGNFNFLGDNYYRKILIENFSRIIDLILNFLLPDSFEDLEELENIFDNLIKIQECKKWIEDNYIKIISCTPQDSMNFVLNKLNFIPEINDLINGKFSKSYLSDIVLSKFIDIDYEVLKNEKILDFFRELFNEVMTVENCNIKNIELLGMGTTTTAWKINKMTIKIGERRRTPKMPFFSDYALSYLRTPIPMLEKEKEMTDVFEDKKPLCFVEVMPVMDEIGRITPYEESKIISKLKQLKIIYKDWFPDNFGRLPYNGNKYGWNNITYVNPESLGYFFRASDDRNSLLNEAGELRKGDVVVLDTDGFESI